MDFLPDIAPQLPPYDVDTQIHLTTELEWFGNDSVDDCVIAARAHHTIRLVWARSLTMAPISAPDVINFYNGELRNSPLGLDLGTSLGQWRDQGWPYGGQLINPPMHKIQGLSGQYAIDSGTYPSPDQSPALTSEQLQVGICANLGAQVGLVLPQGVETTALGTYGSTHPWNDTSVGFGKQHAVFLTGYDANFFYGINWNQRQPMTWEFLEAHCFGVFFVQANETT